MEGRAVKIDALLAGLITECRSRGRAERTIQGRSDLSDGGPDAPAPEVPAAPADTDADGLTDDADKCPTEPEDKDGFEDADGCPDADNDADGIADAADQGPGFLKAKVYDKAIEEFTAAYAIAPIPVLQYNIALAYDGLRTRRTRWRPIGSTSTRIPTERAARKASTRAGASRCSRSS